MWKIIMVFILWRTIQERKSASAGVAISRSRSIPHCHYPLEDSSNNLIKSCEDLHKEVDNNSTLDLDSNLDLDADLDLDAINKIKKHRPADKKAKSDKKEASYLSTPNNKRPVELSSCLQISTRSESVLKANKISAVLDIPSNLFEEVETQQTPNASKTYSAISDITYSNISHIESDKLSKLEYLIDLP